MLKVMRKGVLARTLEWWWEIIAPIGLIAIIAWWFGPIEVITSIIQVLVVVAVFGFLLQVIVWMTTGGR